MKQYRIYLGYVAEHAAAWAIRTRLPFSVRQHDLSGWTFTFEGLTLAQQDEFKTAHRCTEL